MKTVLLMTIFGVLCLPMAATCQSGNFGLLQAVNPRLSEMIKQTAREFSPQEQKDLKVLRRVFWLMQKRFLRKHQTLSTVQQMMDAKTYDCVTGTLLYAGTLDLLGYDFTIKEFNYHTFLIVHLPDKNILFESTEPSGFIYNEKEISDRTAYYGNGGGAEMPIDKAISIENLIGLYYYNQAVREFNARRMAQAKSVAELALAHYPSDRIQAFRTLLDQPYRLILASIR